MAYNRQRNDGPPRGGYQYGQQTPMGGGNPNVAGNLLANLAPEAQVALANTLLSTILQGQQAQPNFGPVSSFGPYPQQQLQQQQQGYYDDRRGYRNEPQMKQPRFGGDRWQGDRNRGHGGNRNVDNFRQRRDDVRRKDAHTKGVRNDNRDRKPQPRKNEGLPKKTPVKRGEKKPEVTTTSKPTKDEKQEKEEEKSEKVETTEQAADAKVEEKVAENAEDADKAEEVAKEKEGIENAKADDENATEEKAKDEKESGEKKKEEKGEKPLDIEEKKQQERANDKTEYAGIPEAYLYCHICEKQVWDGPSFLRHIRGNKHKNLVRKLEETYDATIESMRLLSQLDEQRRTLDIDSKFSFGRQKHRPRKTRCNMCNMAFYGSILTHRSNQAHQALKNFVHSKCTVCDEGFRSRIDYDHHLLTSKHIKKAVEQSKGEPAQHVKIINLVLEELQFRPQIRELRVEGAVDPAPPVPKDDYDVNVVGPYEVHTPTGQSEIKRRSAFFCNKCGVFIERTEESKQDHLQSKEHLENVEKKSEGKEKDDDEEKLDETMEVVDEVGETAEGEEGNEEEDAGDAETVDVEEQAGGDEHGDEEQADENMEEIAEAEAPAEGEEANNE